MRGAAAARPAGPFGRVALRRSAGPTVLFTTPTTCRTSGRCTTSTPLPRTRRTGTCRWPSCGTSRSACEPTASAARDLQQVGQRGVRPDELDAELQLLAHALDRVVVAEDLGDVVGDLELVQQVVGLAQRRRPCSSAHCNVLRAPLDGENSSSQVVAMNQIQPEGALRTASRRGRARLCRSPPGRGLPPSPERRNDERIRLPGAVR